MKTHKTVVAISKYKHCQAEIKMEKIPFFAPQASALAGLRYAPNHKFIEIFNNFTR
jgi:hypothetical protein